MLFACGDVGRLDAVDCEEQARPWSAGHCDGQSNGQLVDQPSQRRQSGQNVDKRVSHRLVMRSLHNGLLFLSFSTLCSRT